MLLTEAEGKGILVAGGLSIPRGVIVNKEGFEKEGKYDCNLEFPVFAKAQVTHGNRHIHGLVRQANDADSLNQTLKELFSQKDQNNLPVTHLLLESALKFDHEYYLSIGFDTRTRQVVITFSGEGGEGMDDRGSSMVKTYVNLSEGISNFAPMPDLTDFVNELLKIFIDADATLIEINPLVKSDGQWYCLDAKVELDDTAAFRHPDWENYPKRSSMGRPPTEIEQKAQAVSRTDHRGVAGESFFEFPGGTIGVMASGGGASTLAMDALMAEGLQPANYTEYSGNPTREKVAKLAEVVLSLPYLEALYVVGSNANFTDIYDTLAGVVDGLLQSPYVDKPGFAILIRRGGPRWEEAFKMVEERLKGKPIKLKMFGPEFPLVDTAAELKKLLESK